MSTQLIEAEEMIFEVTVQEDTASVHLMAPEADQWVRLHGWFGNMKLVHQIAVNTFENSRDSTADSIIGRVVASIASSPSLLTKLPASSIGNKINEVSQWISEGFTEAEEADGQRIILSGTDFDVQQGGTVWVAGLGDTPVVLTAEQILRAPVSVELFSDPMGDSDTVAMVVNYRDETFLNRHLTLV
jgi:hypothetical protein